MKIKKLQKEINMEDIRDLAIRYGSVFFKGLLIFSAIIILVNAFHVPGFSFGSMGLLGHHNDQASTDIQEISKDLKNLQKTVDDLTQQNKIILQKIAPEEFICNEELAKSIAEKTGCSMEDACKILKDLQKPVECNKNK